MKSLFKKIVTSVLIWEARRVLKKHKPKIVAVTGSVGKTSTKDAIYTVLSQSEFTRKSEKSFNSEIGIPLTILGLPNAWNSFVGWVENIGEGFILPWRREKYPTWLVLEMGVDRPGDIERFKWLEPHIVVFTQFPKIPVHVEYFDSPDEVIKEKKKLKELLRLDGTLIVNADDEEMNNEVVKEGQHLLSFGYSENATVRGFNYAVSYEGGLPKGISFKAQFQDKVEEIRVEGILGKHHAYSILAALSVLASEGKTFSGSGDMFKNHSLAPGRMRILPGMNGSVVIDDSYNSSPAAVHAGIDAVGAIETRGKKIVVLGDMMELGDYSVNEHKVIGELVSTSADVFITVGVRMRTAAEKALAANARCKRVEAFQTGAEVTELLRMIISEGDVVFVKGSQSMRMERIVESILSEPETAADVLPRQDPHWKSR